MPKEDFIQAMGDYHAPMGWDDWGYPSVEKLAGFDVLASNETPGFGDHIKYYYLRDQFVGAPAEELKPVSVGEPKKIDSDIVTISGATISSESVVEIVSNSVSQIKDQMQKKGLIGNGK